MKPRLNSLNDSKIEILIVEDSPTQAERLKLLLEDTDYSVTTANNGKVALQILENKKPALIISDIVMPEMNGYEFCKKVKENQDLKNIPVILLTSLSSAQDIVKGLESGADNFIRKPYQDKYLLQRVNYILTNRSIRANEKVQMGISVELGGERHFITSERQQILDLLVSTYEEAVILNHNLENSNRSLNGLYHIAEGLNKAVSVHEVCEIALYRAMELPSVRAGWIFLKNEDGTLKLAHSVNLPEELIAEGAFEGDCQCKQQVLDKGLNQFINNFECQRLKKINHDGTRFKHHASVPLWIRNEVIGIMNLIGPEEGLFNEDELQVLFGIGHQIAIALERANLHENLENLVVERTAALQTEVNERINAEANIKKLNRVYSVLSNINQCIVRERELGNLYREACRIAIDEGGFLFASLGVLNNETDCIQFVAEASMKGIDTTNIVKLRDRLWEKNQLILERFRLSDHFILNDVEHDDFFSSLNDGTLLTRTRSIAIFPLKIFGKLKGTYSLFSSELNFFDEGEVRLLDELAMDISFAMEFAEREKQRRISEEERTRLISILEATPDFVAIHDLEGYAKYINSAGREMLGIVNPESINKWHITQWYPKNTSDFIVNEIIPTVIKEGFWRGETVIVSSNGKETPVSQVIISHVLPNGEAAYLSTIMRDLTEIKKAEEEIMKAKDKAEEMSRLKSNFLANMSHEIRTPLTGIIGSSELLLNELTEPSLVELAEIIHYAGKRLLETLNLILNFSVLESNRMDIVVSEVKLHKLVAEILRTFKPVAQKKNLDLTMDCEPAEITVQLDEKLLLDILNNLVSNAVKYTEEGFVKVKVRKQEHFVIFDVSDSGIGIPEGKENFIFEEFRQVSEGKSRNFEGTGLGLSIAKRCTELMNGTLEVLSKEGSGSTFTLKLPLSLNKGEHIQIIEKESMPTQTDHNQLDDKKEKSLKVLLVEDDETNSRVIERMLDDYCHVRILNNGSDALKAIEDEDFNIVLLDINLGRGLDGIQVMEKIKTIDKYKTLPIVAMTSYAGAEDRNEFLSKGFTHYLAKPFSRKDIIDLLQNINIENPKKAD